jgi:hypothetical protein
MDEEQEECCYCGESMEGESESQLIRGNCAECN